MKKQNMSKKGLMPALLGAVCSVVALTSVSYAWFTIGNEASVGDIDVNVEAADGMLISADGETWTKSLDLDSLIGEGINQLPGENTKLAPVSSAANVVDGVQEIFYGEKDTTLLGREAVAGTEYLVFDLYVKVDHDKDLSIAQSSTVTDVVGSDTNASLASRVSFVNLGSVLADDNYSAEDDLPDLGSDVDTTAVVWEPNSTSHLSTVQASGKVDYKGIASVAEPAAEESLGATTLSTDDVATSDNTATGGLKVADLEDGVNKIRVYIWLEGQDVDCTNDIAEGAFSVSLDFVVTDPVTTEEE